MKKLLCALCIAVLLGNIGLAEAADSEMIKLIYNGKYAGQGMGDIGVALTDYAIENEAGVFEITEMYYVGDVIRYVVVYTPKDQATHFFFDPNDIHPDAERVSSYDVFAMPGPNSFNLFSVGGDHYYSEKRLVSCYTLVNLEETEIAGPFPITIFMNDVEHQRIWEGVFEATIENAGTASMQTIDINEWFGDVYVKKVRISVSPLDLTCVVFHEEMHPERGQPLLSVKFSAGFDSGGSSPSDGYAYCLAAYPEGADLSFDPLVIRYQDKALVISPDGHKEWVDFSALGVMRERALHLIFEIEKGFSEIIIPAPIGSISWIHDYTGNTATQADREAMDAAIDGFRDSTGAAIFVVIENELMGLSAEEYSVSLFNKWGIGDAERNDGILLLLSPANGDVRITVGAGLEDILTDDICGDILDLYALPYLSEGDFSYGLRNTVEAIIHRYSESR